MLESICYCYCYCYCYYYDYLHFFNFFNNMIVIIIVIIHVQVIEFESTALMIGQLGLRVNLIAYPVVSVKKVSLAI